MRVPDKPSRLKGLAWLGGAALLGVTFALGLSPFVRAIPWSWEKNAAYYLGSSSPAEVCGGDGQNRALLQRLVGRIYPLNAADARFSVDVQILRKQDINAFAELGGRISINRGLLEKAQSPEEIAGVLAHEIEHVRRRHVLEGFAVRLMTIEGLKLLLGGSTSAGQWTGYFLHMGFGRTQEAQADEGALQRLQKAHVDNNGFKQFFERMKELPSVPTLLSDHPSDQERSQLTEKFPNQEPRPIMTKEEWASFKDYCQ